MLLWLKAILHGFGKEGINRRVVEDLCKRVFCKVSIGFTLGRMGFSSFWSLSALVNTSPAVHKSVL